MEDAPESLDTGDVLTVLIESFDYYVIGMRENGILLTKSRRGTPILIPMGVDSVPRLVVERLLATFTAGIDAFWQAFAEYEASDD